MSEMTEFHTKLQSIALQFATRAFGQSRIEYQLPSGTIADVISITRDRFIVITEVKTHLVDGLITSALIKYHNYCHYLYIAAPAANIENIMKSHASIYFGSNRHVPGFISINNEDAYIAKSAARAVLQPTVEDYIRQRLETLNDSSRSEQDNNRPIP